MANVLLIVLLIISVILIGLILIQRSEGGALGIGGSGGGAGGGLMSGRGTADLVSRMTGVFGAAFLVVCLLISIAFNYQNQDKSLLDTSSAQEELLKTEKTANPPLNEQESSAKDDTPLAEDSPQAESEAETQEKPQDE
jgi:preprotein translocase subunit SecG